MNPLRWLFRRRRIEGDLDTEIRSHFEMAIAERRSTNSATYCRRRKKRETYGAAALSRC